MRSFPTKYHQFRIGDLIFWKSLAIVSDIKVDHLCDQLIYLSFLKDGRKERWTRASVISHAEIIVDF